MEGKGIPMRLHYLQHVPFEGLGSIEDWAQTKDISISSTKFYSGEELPHESTFDWLVVMGGPMNIFEENKYAWLKQEKRFIEKAIDKDKTVLGICLGAQLVANVLGADVQKNAETEIGWFELNLTDDAPFSPVFEDFPLSFMGFHWHGDTFSIPESAKNMAYSDACQNQAFEYNRKVVGLQFHLETSPESANLLIENSADELVNGKYIQTKEEMLAPHKNFLRIRKNLDYLLNALYKETEKNS